MKLLSWPFTAHSSHLLGLTVLALVAIAVQKAAGFHHQCIGTRSCTGIRTGSRNLWRYMIAPKPSGFAGTRTGKLRTLNRTSLLIHDSYFIAMLPIHGAAQKDIDLLRSFLPEGVKASVVKNTLMKRSLEHTNFSVLIPAVQQQNMFLFMKEGESQPSLEAIQKWQREANRLDPDMAVKGCAAEGQLFLADKAAKVLDIPDRQGLLGQVAWALQQLPQELVEVIKAIGSSKDPQPAVETAGLPSSE